MFPASVNTIIFILGIFYIVTKLEFSLDQNQNDCFNRFIYPLISVGMLILIVTDKKDKERLMKSNKVQLIEENIIYRI